MSGHRALQKWIQRWERAIQTLEQLPDWYANIQRSHLQHETNRTSPADLLSQLQAQLKECTTDALGAAAWHKLVEEAQVRWGLDTV